MMKLEEQVVSLDLAKRLKELGAKQESLFYWVENFRGIELCGKDNFNIEWSINPESNRGNWSAFTVAELGELLPTSIKKRYFMLKMSKANYYKQGVLFDIWYDSKESFDYGEYNICESIPPSRFWIREPKEADARAKMLIYLIENNFLKT